MGIGKMKAFIKKMWLRNDREMIVRHLASVVPEHTLITDYTFEVARLLDGDTNCAVIILNEKQFPLFIGFCEGESEKNSYLAHWFIKNRVVRLKEPMPYNAVDDRCCNSHHPNVNVKQGLYVDLWGMERCGKKDLFHFQQLGNDCLVPANKKGCAAWRAKVVERLRYVVWEKPLPKQEVVNLYNATVAIKDLYAWNKQHSITTYSITTLDEIMVMRALVKSNFHWHKNTERHNLLLMPSVTQNRPTKSSSVK
jgi:hypothetical protein